MNWEFVPTIVFATSTDDNGCLKLPADDSCFCGWYTDPVSTTNQTSIPSATFSSVPARRTWRGTLALSGGAVKYARMAGAASCLGISVKPSDQGGCKCLYLLLGFVGCDAPMPQLSNIFVVVFGNYLRKEISCFLKLISSCGVSI